MVAAAYVHTIRKWGPDRVAGFSPIPAMSMVSHASGARFTSLIGGSMLSFYDWYADLPVASPQVFGDQTDVPESGDWWDAGYLIMWGSNVPVTRTPDAHWMTEARYRGQKVVVVVARLRRQRQVRRRVAGRQPGHRRRAGDGDGPRDPQGVLRRPADAVLRRLHQEATPTCRTWSRSTRSRPATAATTAPGKFLTAADLAGARRRGERRTSRPCSSTRRTGEPRGPERRARAPLRRRRGRAVEPRPRRGRPAADRARAGRRDGVRSSCRASTTSTGRRARCRASVPVRRVGDRLVTTVFDLMLAQYGVGRRGPRRRLRHVATTTPPRRTRRPGRRRSPASRRQRPPGSPASSRRTPRSPAAAR